MTIEQQAASADPQSRVQLARRRLSRLSGRVSLYPPVEFGVGILAMIAGLMGYLAVTGQVRADAFGPIGRTALLVALLLPFMALFILVARRVAVIWLQRRRGLMGARLHVRLLGLFAVLSAVPTLLVVIFASLLFQSGTQFWFSDNAQTVLRNAEEVAQAYVEENRQRIVGDIFSMGGDIFGYAQDLGTDSPIFAEGVDWQLAARNLSEAVIFAPAAEMSGYRVVAAAEAEGALGEEAVLTQRLNQAALAQAAAGETAILTGRADRVEAIVRLDPSSDLFLYASRTVDPDAVEAADQAAGARSEYSRLLRNSRDLQWRFNALLGAVALLVLAAAILSAIWLANRLTSPIGRLAEAAERVGEGDLSARVGVRETPDELGLLARSFNRMAGQLEAQTGDLKAANADAENHSRFIEAVLEGVSAGVIAVNRDGSIDLVSAAAAELLGRDADALVGRDAGTLMPEFQDLLTSAWNSGEAAGEVQLARGDETLTLLVRVDTVPGSAGQLVLTFDDITQQLADQRRAAWADVARRIAHEIKNPLTPIQLSAERLQRRFGDRIEDETGIFSSLTSTIVRQVGDLRRIVDEFSSFARMPKPVFREESVREIARQALFLQEVGNPEVRYRMDARDELPPLLCDRRQFSQALTNLMKNAAEALAESGTPDGEVVLSIGCEGDDLLVDVCDNGPGMPADLKARVTEPYVTTRARGTGLGLAIVQKIVEDHGGSLQLFDRPGGGTCVRMTFDVMRGEREANGGELAMGNETEREGG